MLKELLSMIDSFTSRILFQEHWWLPTTTYQAHFVIENDLRFNISWDVSALLRYNEKKLPETFVYKGNWLKSANYHLTKQMCQTH